MSTIRSREVPHKLFDNVTLGGLQKRNRLLKKILRTQLAAHREETGVKTALVSPYETAWPRIKRETQQMVIEKIKSAIGPMQHLSRGGKKVKEKPKVEEESTGDDFTDSLRRQKKDTEEQKRQEIKQRLIFGINEATRRLERDELSCLVVCSSTGAICPNNHLQILAATRQCPAMCIRDLSIIVGKAVGMKSMLVLAIRKSPPAPKVDWVEELVKVISDNAIEVHAHFLVKTEETETDPKPVELKPEPSQEKPSKPDTKISKKPFDINSLYIKSADSDWLKDETKIVPVLRDSKSTTVGLDFIAFDSVPKAAAAPVARKSSSDPFILPEMSEEPAPKKKKLLAAGYLPPHVRRVTRNEQRKKKQMERKKKKQQK